LGHPCRHWKNPFEYLSFHIWRRNDHLLKFSFFIDRY
jgi:hypothetical protein